MTLVKYHPRMTSSKRICVSKHLFEISRPPDPGVSVVGRAQEGYLAELVDAATSNTSKGD